MKLTKHPETELEYWAVIESLGGFVYHTNRDVNRGRVDGSKVDTDIIEARNLQAQLAKEITDKFGVIHEYDGVKPPNYFQTRPEDYPDAPEHLIWYWDWYYNMKIEAFREEYENSICGKCPFCSGGLRGFAFGSSIPCDEFSGSLYRLSQPHLCGVIKSSTNEYGTYEPDFLEKMYNEHGAEAVSEFTIHRAKLTKTYDLKVAECKRKRVQK